MAIDIIEKQNERLLGLLSGYLNSNSTGVDQSIVMTLMQELGLGLREAYSHALAIAMGLDIDTSDSDRDLFHRYFDAMLHPLDANFYRSDPYYREVNVPTCRIGRWELKTLSYKPYEAFVCNDMRMLDDGRILPQIGFFTEEFLYPAALECGREWMSVTPNEINTMRPAIDGACGNTLVYGLGLGYFAYMVARKSQVRQVTVVERDAEAILLAKEFLLPRFQNVGKLTIVESDAFEYADKQMAGGDFDTVFVDLWHDVGDGIELYQKMKLREPKSPHSRYFYWIEPTLKCYLD